MKYRRLSPAGDMTFGQGDANFLVNTPETVAQAVMTRLRLLLGEWFMDTTDGTAWKTRVLGRYTQATHDPELRARILGTPGVVALVLYQSRVDAELRSLFVDCLIDTVYGQVTFAGTI